MADREFGMGIREKLNEKPQYVVAFCAVAVVVVVLVLFLTRGNPATDTVSQMYYSDDDGKTYFADSTNKIFPFDHNGKKAYRAFVYQGKGQPFVGYLSRYNDAAHAKLTELQGKEDDPANASTIAQLKNSSIEVKKPGDTKWVPVGSSEGQAITIVTSPDGGPVRGLIP